MRRNAPASGSVTTSARYSVQSCPVVPASRARPPFLSVDAVKTHMRALFDKFGVGDVPQNQKRAKLVERAFQSGAIGPKNLV